MSDTIEQKALALVNEVRAEDSGFASVDLKHLRHADTEELEAALCRAIEQHEAFRQEVSEAVGKLLMWPSIRSQGIIVDNLARFIIAKPDPLVEALDEIGVWGPDRIDQLRAAIEKRGGKIIFNEEQK